MTEQQEKPKKRPTSADYMPFWRPFFDGVLAATGQVPPFYAKLCYPGKEFSLDGSSGPCVRFYPSELQANKDIYFELFNWTADHFEEGQRVLYRLPYTPGWTSDIANFLEITTDSKGAAMSPVYSVNFKHFELINRTSIKSMIPVFETAVVEKPAPAKAAVFSAPAATAQPSLFPPVSPEMHETFNEEEEAFGDRDDAHYTGATIRDLYCMIQNVPLSNKNWLNMLIKQGKAINLNRK
jgi:hypothetical protein